MIIDRDDERQALGEISRDLTHARFHDETVATRELMASFIDVWNESVVMTTASTAVMNETLTFLDGLEEEKTDVV